MVFICKVIGNSLSFLWRSQQPYEVRALAPIFQGRKLTHAAVFSGQSWGRRGLNSRLCAQTKSQERRAVWASGQGAVRALSVRAADARGEGRWQVWKTLLWPWLWCKDA